MYHWGEVGSTVEAKSVCRIIYITLHYITLHYITLFPVLTALPSVTATGVQRCGWALYEWAERQVYITSYSPRGDANRTYSTIAIHWYFSLHVWLCSWDYCRSSIVATTLKIALHRWINHRVCHEITGSVASCTVCRAYMHMLHK